MNTACRFCKKDFASLNLPKHSRRVICGSDECWRLYWNETNAAKRENRQVDRTMDSAERKQGRFYVPSQQGKLDKDIKGRQVYCPCCGQGATVSTIDYRLECQSCRALWVLSVGRTEDGTVAVVRMDRWL